MSFDPSGVRVIRIETAVEMAAACEEALPSQIAVMTAAVADWRTTLPAYEKIKKQADNTPLSLELTENPDILAGLANHTHRPDLIVGFAAETDDLEANAKSKLTSKNCDWVIANKIGEEGIGFGSDNNAVTIFKKDGSSETHGPTTKLALAQTIIQAINDSLGNTPS